MDLYMTLQQADQMGKIKLSPPTDTKNRKKIIWDTNESNNQDMKPKNYEDVLKRRKERFGEVSPPKPKYQKTNTPVTSISTVNVHNFNVLKKRSERFGESVSSLMKKIEEKEKMRKRQARFSSRMVTTSPTSVVKKLNVGVFQHPSPSTVELFQTIDQIDADERRKMKV